MSAVPGKVPAGDPVGLGSAGVPCGTDGGRVPWAAGRTSVPAAAQRAAPRPVPATAGRRGSAPSPGPPARASPCHLRSPQALLKEANARGEKLSGLEAVAWRLKDFSRQQDGAVIQSLVLAARERLGKVLQRAAERGAALEEARKRAKQVRTPRRGTRLRRGAVLGRQPRAPWFAPGWCTMQRCRVWPTIRVAAAASLHTRTPRPTPRPFPPFQFSESRRLLLDWMDEVEQSLEVPQDAATSQEEIKCQLAEHKVGAQPRAPAPPRWGSWMRGAEPGGCGVSGEGSPAPSGTAEPLAWRKGG